MKLSLKHVRLAFPSLWHPEQVQGEGKPAFSASFIIPRDHPQLRDIENTILQVANAQWGAKAMDILRAIKAKDALCVHNGDAKAEWTGFAGNLYISARSETRPLVVDRDRSILVQADGRPYAGCYVNPVLDIWAQDNKFGRRINAGLSGVQFDEDGEAFAGGVPATVDDFDNLDASQIPAGGGGTAGGGGLF